jgi:hypothetical protein
MELTKDQEESLDRIKENWGHVSEPFVIFGGDGAVGVWCGSLGHPEQIMIGIEPDGYAHS